jgi:hypothetical protein
LILYREIWYRLLWEIKLELALRLLLGSEVFGYRLSRVEPIALSTEILSRRREVSSVLGYGIDTKWAI